MWHSVSTYVQGSIKLSISESNEEFGAVLVSSVSYRNYTYRESNHLFLLQ